MGILSDFKRLFFVKKAVVKSAGDKAVDRSKEAVNDLKEEAREAWDKAVAGTDKLADNVNDALDLDEAVAKAKSFTEKMRSKVEGKDADHSNKAQEAKKSSHTYHEDHEDELPESNDGSKTQDQIEGNADRFAERAKEISEKLGNKALDLGEDAVKKAKEIARKLESKIDETVDKANKLAEEEARDKTEGSHASTRHDENTNLTESSLSGKDSFFEKAERFASNEPLEKEDPVIKKEKTTPKKTTNKAYGFEDMDGDGNEIVDDAIMDDENTEEEDK